MTSFLIYQSHKCTRRKKSGNVTDNVTVKSPHTPRNCSCFFCLFDFYFRTTPVVFHRSFTWDKVCKIKSTTNKKWLLYSVGNPDIIRWASSYYYLHVCPELLKVIVIWMATGLLCKASSSALLLFGKSIISFPEYFSFSNIVSTGYYFSFSCPALGISVSAGFSTANIKVYMKYNHHIS